MRLYSETVLWCSFIIFTLRFFVELYILYTPHILGQKSIVIHPPGMAQSFSISHSDLLQSLRKCLEWPFLLAYKGVWVIFFAITLTVKRRLHYD